MNSENTKIKQVPTNIITGFLGVGKTSAILHFLKSKPANERWAVLVNEFGEIGVDGSLIQGQGAKDKDIFIQEVPGGCMCCAAGLPLQIALSRLLLIAKPDRLLIEPTGLGHPKEILQLLSADHYQSVLSLQKTLTLVDARNLSDERYTKHDTFKQQIEMADTVVGNKQDLYKLGDKRHLALYVKKHAPNYVKVVFSQQGEIEFSQLQGMTLNRVTSTPSHMHTAQTEPLASDVPIPECGFIKATNQGEGFMSVGWRFLPEVLFIRSRLLALLTGLKAERMKAVFITEEGVFAYNLTSDALTETSLSDTLESRIELIGDQLSDNFESHLMDCMSSDIA